MSKERVRCVIYALHLGDHDYRYVGKSVRGAYIRLQKHKREAREHLTKQPVHDWMRKYGPENVQMEVLAETPDKTNLWKLERHYILSFRAAGYRLLNVKDGEPDPNTGKVLSPERRAQISDQFKALWKTDEYRQRMLQKPPRTGWHHSEDFGKKMAERQRGEANPLAKLTERSVHEMRVLHKFGFSVPAISQMYDMSPLSTSQAISGYTWKHVTTHPPVPLVRGSRWTREKVFSED